MPYIINNVCFMANINNNSVREQIEELRNKFKKLSSTGKVSKESLLLIEGLFLVVNLMFALFLEKSTKKTSKNSSIPPSQTEPDESSISKSKTNGKGKSENGLCSDNVKFHETVTIATVDTCDVCDNDLSNVDCHSHERRTRIDIIFEKTIEHVDAEIKDCPCGATVKASFPSDMHGKRQYGNGLKAFIINLLVCQMVSLNRVQKLIKSMTMVVIAEATMLKFILRLHQSLSNWEEEAITHILKAPSMNVDETSLKVEKSKHWIHVYSSQDITLKFLHEKRGTEAINDINIIPKYGGVIIHDCWSSYLSYDNCAHALCGSHLLRELEFIIESNGYKWASNLKSLLQEACKMVSSKKAKKLSKGEYSNLQKRYRNILTRGNKELPVIPPQPKGKRGRMPKSDAHNLWERLHKYEKEVLLFAKEASVSFTNNRAERDLRMAKVKQKVSGCFRSSTYAQAYCRISSYIQTMGNKGYNPLVAIQIALHGDAHIHI